MNSKLTINLSTGTLDVEGTEEFVKEIYKDFKNLLSNKSINEFATSFTLDKNESKLKETERNISKLKTQEVKSTISSKSKQSSDLKVLTDLNLRPSGGISLRDFAAQYTKITSIELSLVSVFYLKEILKIDKVTVNHIFTSMKELGRKIPTPFKQVLTNHKNSKNWINVTDWDDIKFTVQGMNHIEHDMSKA